MKHFETLKRRLQLAPRSDAPAPWKVITAVAVGGLTSVGFGRDSDRLLVVSSQGRSVIDCVSGEIVARDRSEYFEDETHLEAEGIGPLSGQLIRLSGLHGGGLLRSTNDGWSVELVTHEWPLVDILLFEPGSWLYGSLHNKPDTFRKLAADSELRGCGFSETGRSLVIATSADVTIIGRGANNALHATREDARA